MRCPARLAFLLEYPLRKRLLGLERLVAALPLMPGTRVLDLGAGSGVVARLVVEQAPEAQIVLADPQSGMLRRARGRVNGPARFVAAVGESLPFAAEDFDLVLMITVLGELDEPKLALREVRRVLRPGGMLFIAEHLPDLHFRPLNWLRRLLSQVGFAEQQGWGGRWSYTACFTKVEVGVPAEA